jgi:hypothetical protein
VNTQTIRDRKFRRRRKLKRTISSCRSLGIAMWTGLVWSECSISDCCRGNRFEARTWLAWDMFTSGISSRKSLANCKKMNLYQHLSRSVAGAIELQMVLPPMMRKTRENMGATLYKCKWAS